MSCSSATGGWSTTCRLLLRDHVEAEDAAQQAFLSAHRSLLGGTEPREPAAWLATIARNECRARIRARMTQPLALVNDPGAVQADLEQVTGQRAEIAALCEALAQLPKQQRDAIVLREFYGLSHDEVSLALGTTASAVDALLVRARRRLQSELRPRRLASGALVVPFALRDSLAQAMPGFASTGGASGAVGKIASLPLVAKLAGVAATVAVVGTVGAAGYWAADAPSRPPSPATADTVPAEVVDATLQEFDLKGRPDSVVSETRNRSETDEAEEEEQRGGDDDERDQGRDDDESERDDEEPQAREPDEDEPEERETDDEFERDSDADSEEADD